MKTNHLNNYCHILLLLILTTLLGACSHNVNVAKADKQAKDSIDKMTNNISRDLAAKGPIAWLAYLDDSPKFFMISDGKLSFPDHESAEKFIKDTLVKQMSKVKLTWKNKRIDIFSPHVATICSGFHEDITMTNGQKTSFDGYFSGMTIFTPNVGWKLVNLHWSTIKPDYK